MQVFSSYVPLSLIHIYWTVKPEIMIPLLCEVNELKYVKKMVVETADAEIAAAGVELEYEVATMIEIPRAALTADEIATESDFFCFGTNDLTPVSYTHLQEKMIDKFTILPVAPTFAEAIARIYNDKPFTRGV